MITRDMATLAHCGVGMKEIERGDCEHSSYGTAVRFCEIHSPAGEDGGTSVTARVAPISAA
jgi:hypothetical protein